MALCASVSTYIYTHPYEVDPAERVGVSELDGFREQTKIASQQDGRLPPTMTDTLPHSCCHIFCGLVTHTAYRVDNSKMFILHQLLQH